MKISEVAKVLDEPGYYRQFSNKLQSRFMVVIKGLEPENKFFYYYRANLNPSHVHLTYEDYESELIPR
jgi:hypothetical protein